MDRLFAINTAAVASDIIDGEAIILHRVSGNYFSTEGAGSLIWQWIGEGEGDLEHDQPDPGLVAPHRAEDGSQFHGRLLIGP